MQLAYLKAKNFKNIEEIEIRFIDEKGTQHSAIIKGKNQTGKSSVIDAFLTTLKGFGTIKEPLRQGQTSGKNTVHILIDQDKEINGIPLKAGTTLICERKFTANSNTLTVSTMQGTEFKKPKALLDAILGMTVIRDPMELMNMAPREQQNFVMEFLGINTNAIDLEITAANKVIYDKQIELGTIEQSIPEMMPETVVDPRTDTDTLDALASQWEKYDREVTAIETQITVQRAGIISARGSIDEIESEITRLKAKLETQKRHLADKLKALEDMNEEKPEPPAKTKEEIKALGSQINAYKEYKHFVAGVHDGKVRLQFVRDEIADQQTKRHELKKQKEKLLTHSLPVEGLTFGEDGLLLNGLPITPEQISESQQYMLWLDILFAMHPEMHCVWFKAAHSFDTERKQAVLDKCAEHGYIALMEEVSDDPQVKVVLIENKPKSNEPKISSEGENPS